MAKKLGQMAKRIDDIETGKTIRCLIVEDNKTGMLKKIRDPKMFKEIIEKTDEMFLTKVYQPTEKDKLDLINFIQNQAIETEDGKKRMVAKDEEVYIWLLRFTDIEPSEDEQENLNAINNPSELLIQVSQELNTIMMQVISNYQEIKRTLNSLPEEVIDTLNEVDLKNKEEQIAKEKEIKETEKEIEELKKKLSKLEGIID